MLSSVTCRRRWLAAAPVLTLALSALAGEVDSYHFALRSQQSSVMTDVSAGATLAGTLIGNYDVDANPTGTRTIPGLFGPTSGNTPIPFTGTAGFAGSDTSRPAGEFNLVLDLSNGTAVVSGLSIDITNGRELGVTLGIVLEYESFRTRQPTAVFPGGIPIPIPFGQVNLTSLTLTQTDISGPGTLEETGPNMYRVTLIAPVELTASVDTPGNPLEIGPLLVPLPLVFDVTLNGATAAAALSFEQSFVQQIPVEIDLPADQPLDLPTILPPGSTAHLLVNAALDSFDFDVNLAATLDAAGARMTFSRADWNRNGVVNSVDFFEFLLEFLTQGVDFNDDGVSNSQDYFDYVVVYFEDR